MDALNAVEVDSLKKSVLDSIKYKRERNEFKIKRIRDLIEQLQNESNYLETRKSDYTDIIQRIRARFNSPDFAELQQVEDLDPADFENIKVIPKDAGKQTIDGVINYLVLNIDAAKKSITFSNIAPPIKPGDTITLSGGSNDGTKTVLGWLNSRTIVVKEDMITEQASKTKVKLST
jgi:hypothetical protein